MNSRLLRSPLTLLSALLCLLVLLSGCEDRAERVRLKAAELETAKSGNPVDADRNPRIQIVFDGGPTLIVELLESHYPDAVNRFMALVRDGYYGDFLTVEEQDPKGKNNLTGKNHLYFRPKSGMTVSASGYTAVYAKEATAKDAAKEIKHLAEGKLSVPKTGDIRTLGFAITREADPLLDAKYVPIGVVIKGKESLHTISSKMAVKSFTVVRYSRKPEEYVLNKNDVPPAPIAAPRPTPAVEATTGNPTAVIQTELGDIKVELFEDAAPKTVGNFVSLALKGFYDNGVFHRIEDWVVQGGDPTGTGSGGPGYSFDNEINWDSLKLTPQQTGDLATGGFKSTAGLKSLPHDVGVLSMAHAGAGTNGSQFFIIRNREAKFLDGKHTVFGKVTEGMNLVEAFQNGTKVNILAVRMLTRRAHKYLPGDKGPSTEPEEVAAVAVPMPAPVGSPTLPPVTPATPATPVVTPVPAPAPEAAPVTTPAPAPAPVTTPAPAPVPAPAPAPAPAKP